MHRIVGVNAAEWSPQQIAARLIRDYPDDLAMRVSHETISKTLFIQARGALRKELTACLRTGRAQRRPHMRTEQSGAGRIRNPILISERPPEVEGRAVPDTGKAIPSSARAEGPRLEFWSNARAATSSSFIFLMAALPRTCGLP